MTTASYCTANGVRVLRATISRPLRGAWYADLEIDSQTVPAPGDAMTIVVTGESSSVTLSGVVATAGVFVDKLHVRAVGGKGGLSNRLAERWYVETPLSIPLGDAVREAGESLSSTSSADALAFYLRRFARPKDVASAVIDLLAEQSGASWRVLEDGTIFFGTDSFPDAGVTAFDLVSALPEDNRIDVALDVPLLRPGTSFQGRNIGRVIDTIEASSVRTTVYFVAARDDGLLGRLESLVRRVVDRRLAYRATYQGTVIAQRTSGTLDVKLDTDLMPGMTELVVQWGFPDASAKVQSGARVIVGFSDPDSPSPLPYVIGWLSAAFDELDIGTTSPIPVVRVGDSVAAGWLVFGPGGVPFIGYFPESAAGAAAAATAAATAGGSAVHINAGAATSGSSKLKAE